MKKIILKEKTQSQKIQVRLNNNLKIKIIKGFPTIVLNRADGSAKGFSINKNETKPRIVDVNEFESFYFDAQEETIINYELQM